MFPIVHLKIFYFYVNCLAIWCINRSWSNRYRVLYRFSTVCVTNVVLSNVCVTNVDLITFLLAKCLLKNNITTYFRLLTILKKLSKSSYYARNYQLLVVTPDFRACLLTFSGGWTNFEISFQHIKQICVIGDSPGSGMIRRRKLLVWRKR